MITPEELRKVSREVYHIKLGCLSLAYKGDREGNQISAKEFHEKLNERILSDTLVSRIEKKYDSPRFYEEIIAEGIGSTSSLGKVEILSSDPQIPLYLDYPLEALDPDYYKLHGIKHRMKVVLLYDGFLCLVAIRNVKGVFNYQRHSGLIVEWLDNTLSSMEQGWEIRFRRYAPSPCNINLFLLKEVPKGVDSSEYQPGLKYELLEGRNLYFSYLSDTKEATSDTFLYVLKLLYLYTEKMSRHFYSCEFIETVLRAMNDKAWNMIGQLANGYTEFYDINFFNLHRRFSKCTQLGKTLAQLYTLMPDIEAAHNRYEDRKRGLEDEKESASFGFPADMLAGMLIDRLSEPRRVAFTASLNEMLHQSVSEVRAQTNYQLLAFTAILTFIAVIVAAVLGVLV